MAFTVKKEGKLIFNDLGGYETRNSSTIWCIQEADKIYNWKDFKEIRICTDDYEHDENAYTYSKYNRFHRLVPDFNFHAWPQVGIHDYTNFVKDIDNAGLVSPTINKVGWIGNPDTNFMRKRMINIGNSNKNLFDFFGMSWKPSETIVLNSTHYVSTPELVKTYAAVIDIEGRGYSGRIKHLLWSHRPLLLVDRPHREYFHEFIKPWEHYIPVKRDLSDLVEKTEWVFNNYEKALEIAERAYQFSKIHLTREASYKQWDTIIKDLI
jgi:hypothetical protein